MTEKTAALLVHQNSETLRALKHALESQGVRVSQAGSRAEAKRMLGGLNPAPLVFTDPQLPDGTWADILTVAEKALLPVNVIVVARLVDTRFYVEVIEAGAYDFIAPPFNATDLAYVIRSAVDNVIARRTAQPRREPSSAEDGLFSQASESGARASTN
ncbi:MAG: response regulator [Terriglobia bacterium]|jgi:two-component system response regulator PilR (NtrC family)